MTTDLVEEAPQMALTLREGLNIAHRALVFQTDKGTQYASSRFRSYTKAKGLAQSMGATGVAWDDAMAESFFATLKTEFFYRQTGVTTSRQAWQLGTGSKRPTTAKGASQP